MCNIKNFKTKIQTTDKIFHVHIQDALPGQPLRVRTAYIHRMMEVVINQPFKEPLQMAITEQTACVQNPAEKKRGKETFVSFYISLVLKPWYTPIHFSCQNVHLEFYEKTNSNCQPQFSKHVTVMKETR